MIGLSDSQDMLPSPGAAKDAPPSRAPQLAAHIFSPGGSLQSGLQLEHRPQQESMARAVARAFATDAPLLFEAGTGVGKSLAYLLPGIIHATDQSRQLIVSTHTIALQEQIDRKDLPLCRRVFSASPATAKYADFRSAVLLGKGNYLCTTRLAAALRDKHELFATAEHTELQRIAAWASASAEGLRHELNPPPAPEVWEMVNADSSACARKYCDCEKCFYQRARARIHKAQVIIVNHSLLFALLNAGGAPGGDTRGVLFPDDFVVLDEAHTVPSVATDYFGLRISSYGVGRMLHYLYNPRTKRGLLKKTGALPHELQLVDDALEASRQFFAHVEERLLLQRPIVRVRAEGCAEPWLDGPLTALHKVVLDRADKQPDDSSQRNELLEQASKIKNCQTGIAQFLTVAEPDKLVYWAERSGRRHTIVTLRTAPIDVAPCIREALFERHTSVVCTSATLALGGRIEPFQARIGAHAADAALEASPFDFARNMRVYAPTDIPPPSPQDARLALDSLIDYIDFCTRRTPGGSLVLFTSYHDMKRVAEELEPVYQGAARPFFMQGPGLSRTELAHRFREAGNGILFGTDSFWTGIDVPGPSLSQVIITRLPFEVPTHPVLEARTEWVRDQGGNPFNEITLPEALMTFRQGVGRLIRSARDRGVITLLDPRIVQKTYGRLFIDSLPNKNLVRINRNNRAEKFQPFP